VPLPPPTPVAARTLARYRELTARAEQLVAAITPPNARREDVPLRGPSARTLPNGGLPDSLTNGIRYDSPATASRLWEVTTNSTAALSHWVATQHIPGATLAGSVDLKATDPSPSAGFSQQTITFAVAATASIPAGAVTVHVFHADATRSGMMVDALIPWTSGIAPSMPNFANSGYPTVTRLLPDLAPDAALRCHYPRRPDSVLSTTASATRTYSAAAARSLTGRLSAAPIGQLHASIDNLTAEAAPADLLILTHPGRAPVVLSFTGYGISNGDLIIAVPHVNPVDGSPLWLPGTASLSSILDQTA